jgi:hypothetical protein
MAKYKLFEECSQYTTDPYWKKVFENCSKGRFPKNSGYDESNISIWFRYGKDINWYRVVNNPEQDYNDIKKCFKEYLKLRSEKDKLENRADFNILKDELDKSYIGNWKNIKKKNIRDSLIRHYILHLKKVHNLDIDQTINLSRDIRQAMLFGWITPDHIDYSNRKIQNISNLRFENSNFIIDKVESASKQEYYEWIPDLLTIWKKRVGAA